MRTGTSVGKAIVQEENTTEFAGYFNYRLNVKKVVFDPGNGRRL